MDAPKCRVCGVRHWGVVCNVTNVDARVTKVTRVARVVTRVTPEVTEEALIQAAVSTEHECPLCGRLHEPESKAAKKQRAYRERHR